MTHHLDIPTRRTAVTPQRQPTAGTVRSSARGHAVPVDDWTRLDRFLALGCERTGVAARLVVAGLASNGFSIAEPGDAGMLDVAGFGTAAPAVIADVIRATWPPPAARDGRRGLISNRPSHRPNP